MPEGAILTLYMTPTVAEGEWWCVSLRHGDGWGSLPDPIPGQYENPENGVLSVVLTKEVLADIVANGGLIITGSQFVLNKVDIEWEISLRNHHLVRLMGLRRMGRQPGPRTGQL